MTWFYATSVTVSNGQDYVTVNTGDDIAIAQAAGGLVIGTNPAVEIKRTYVDGSGNKRIELVKPWPYATQTSQPAFAYPTDGDFAAATAVLKDYINTFIKATQVEAEAGTEDSHFMTPLRVKQAVDFYRAFATNAEALAGTNTSKVMNPLRVLEAIQKSGLMAPSLTSGEVYVTDCNAVPNRTTFFCTSDTAANRPTSDSKQYAGVHIQASSISARQIAWCINSGIKTIFSRTGNGNPLVWTAWDELWTSANLVKQSSLLDTTSGRMMTVGAGGMLWSALDVPDLTSTEVNVGRFFRFTNTAVGKPSTINYGSCVALPYDGSPSTYFVGAGLRGDSTRALFFGYKSGAAGTPTWIEAWDKGKNPAQSNVLDTTANAMLTVGSFGWGITGIPPTLGLIGATVDTLTRPTGLYRASTADAGTKPFGLTDYTFLEARYSATATSVLAWGTGGEMFSHGGSGGAWNANGWRRQYDNINALGAVTHDGTKSTGALLEYGANANGTYYKYADGRMECLIPRGSVALTANTDEVYAWTFPAAFAVAPSHIGSVIGGASVTNIFNINKTAYAGQSATGVTMRTNVSASQNHSVSHFAIGRWR